MKPCWQASTASIHWPLVYFLPILMLGVPVRWILAAFLSALIHELFHLLSIWICRKRVLGIEVGLTGTRIDTEPLYGWQKILCLVAGPVGSLGQILLVRWLPLTAFFGLIQGLFNLIPVVPLDGGRILECILQLKFTESTVRKAMMGIEWFVYFFVITAFLYGLNIFPTRIWAVVAIIWFTIRWISRKIPCKLSQLGVQ